MYRWRDTLDVGQTTGDGADRLIAEVRGWIASARRLVVLTGAGISTDSGIPDFRGPQGLWTKNPEAEKLATLNHYLADPEIRRRAWRSRLESETWQARPNAAHRALVTLEKRGVLDTLVTQNIDELHQMAGNDPTRVVELHGTMRWVQCWSCGQRTPMEEVLERVRAGEDDPSCRAVVDGRVCAGILKSATISFGQNLDPATLVRAEQAARSCDLLLAVGSSLMVHPAAGLVPLARDSGSRVVIVNGEPTPYDYLADAVINGPIGEIVPAIVGED